MPLAMSVTAPCGLSGYASALAGERVRGSFAPRLRARIVSTWSPISASVVPGCIELTNVKPIKPRNGSRFCGRVNGGSGGAVDNGTGLACPCGKDATRKSAQSRKRLCHSGVRHRHLPIFNSYVVNLSLNSAPSF